MATSTMIERAPWHHWPMAILTMLFYLLAALDYVLSTLGIGAYTENFPAEFVAFVREMPVWLDVVWAVGVFGGLLGGYLLFRRNRRAVLFLFASVAIFAFLTVWLSLFVSPTIFSLAGLEGFFAMAGSTAIALLFYLYARWERTEHKL